MMIRIGYQGEVGSNSEEAAKQFVNKCCYPAGKYILIPLTSSKNVSSFLSSKEIDVGIMAIKNTIAGVVKETEEALQTIELQVIDTISITIHHCVFAKQNIRKEQITTIVSHIQALSQTKHNRAILFPNCSEQEFEDTASAARNLAQNLFPDNYAVLCRKNAGEQYGLKLIAENTEDCKDNKTEFGIFSILQ